jgi:DNA-binding MarR family transcriptional regulator
MFIVGGFWQTPTFTISTMPDANSIPAQWTHQQGQYLAFIYAYATIHGTPPAERDLQRFFRCTAPSVHSMLKTLERHGFIRRLPGVARSTQMLVPAEVLPVLLQPD